jgi:hypothetical protein
MSMPVAPLLGLLLAATTSTGCAFICLSQQHRGDVKTLRGVVRPGEVVSIELPYDARGDQNDLNLTWEGQQDVAGPRPVFYLSEVECTAFVPPPPGQSWVRDGPCRTIGGRGGFKNATGEIVQTGLTVVGGPHQGPVNARRHAYTLHIVGDATRAVSYVVVVTWFRGPDC